jgi:hypothetical protein
MFILPILFYPVLSYPILSYRILSYPIQSYPILSYPILSYPILSYPVLSSFVDESMKFIRDKQEFDKALKTHFLKKLPKDVKCNNPFCPSCVMHVS